MKLSLLVTRARCQKIPPGWLTNDQLAAAEGFSSAYSFKPTLRAALSLGLVKMKTFRVLWGNCARLRPYYHRVK